MVLFLVSFEFIFCSFNIYFFQKDNSSALVKTYTLLLINKFTLIVLEMETLKLALTEFM